MAVLGKGKRVEIHSGVDIEFGLWRNREDTLVESFGCLA